MKMRTNIKAINEGVILKVLISEGENVEAGELVLRLSDE
jgi:biotin carboxyl carrier protein